jgi:hypothetical protein
MMDPAKARAARIRRDKLIAAKAIAEQRMAEKTQREQENALRPPQPVATHTAPQKQRERKLAASAVRLSHGQHFPQALI